MGSSDGSAIVDVQVGDVWARLSADKSAVLIDVRTRAEWAFVGVPDLTRINKQPLLVEWQTFPDNRIDPIFSEKLAAALQSAGASKDSELFFICRSGGRSKMAAQVMADLGFSRCRNVAEGFEGALDADRHRGTTGGWKRAGLPWVQG